MALLGTSILATSTHEWMAHCRAAEQAGLSSVWAADAFGHDCFVDAALALQVTKGLPVGIAIAMPTRSPLQAATAVASLHELGGRLTLGLGPGHSEEEVANPIGELMFKVVGPYTNRRAHGIPYYPPVERQREYHACVAAALRGPRGELVELRGEHWSIAALGQGISRDELPIVFGGIAPRMTRLAGEVADGLVTHLLAPRELIARRIAAAIVGRDRPFLTAAGVECSLHADERVALRRARAEVGAAMQVPHFVARLRELHGDAAAERIVELIAARRYDEAAEAVPEELVRSMILVSTPDRFRADVEAYAEVEQVLPLPVGQFFQAVPGILGTGPADAAESRESIVRACFGSALRP